MCVLHAVFIVFYWTSKGLHKIYNKILFPIKQSWFSFVTSIFYLSSCSMVLIFGDLNDSESPISKILAKHGGKQIRADLKLNPGVFYQGI